MANVQLSSVVDAAVHIDGVAQVGRASEVEIPKIVLKQQKVGGLALLIDTNVVTGIEAMEGGSITWNGYYSEIFSKLGQVNKEIRMQVRGQVITKDGSGATIGTPLVITMQVVGMDIPLGTYKSGELAEYKSTFSCNYIKVEANGVNKLEADAFNNVYTIDGVDQFANYKANLGI